MKKHGKNRLHLDIAPFEHVDHRDELGRVPVAVVVALVAGAVRFSSLGANQRALTRLGSAPLRYGTSALGPALRATIHTTPFCRLGVDAGRKLNAAPLVVGHSGAGAFLPAIGSAIGTVAGLVFVDAVVPPAAGRRSSPMALLVA
jgi:hypothetical protein